MAVDIEGVIAEGTRRTVARNGLLLVGIVYVLGVLSGLFGPRRPAAPPGGFPAGEMPMAAAPEPVIPVSPVVAAVISLGFALLSAVVTIGGLRTFLTDETERLPSGVFTRRLGWVLVNVVVGGVVFGLAVAVGLVLLVLPGLFLMVTLAFWAVIVVDRDTSFVEGFRRSWRLTSGHRLRLFLLGLVVVVVVFLVNVLFELASAVLGAVVALLGVLVGQVGGAFTTVFVWATLAAAYRQLDGDAADPAVAPPDEFA